MKEMNQEAKDGLNDVIQKMLKDAQLKKKQAEELLSSAKTVEEMALKLSKELESIKIAEKNLLEDQN